MHRQTRYKLSMFNARRYEASELHIKRHRFSKILILCSGHISNNAAPPGGPYPPLVPPRQELHVKAAILLLTT